MKHDLFFQASLKKKPSSNGHRWYKERWVSSMKSDHSLTFFLLYFSSLSNLEIKILRK